MFSKMKNVSMKIALAVVMIAVGTLGLQAQTVRGPGNCGGCTTTCIRTCSNICLLTVEQKAILAEMRTNHRAEIAVLRAELIAAPTLAEKVAIRAEMTALCAAHIAAVKAKLAEWGIGGVKPGTKGITK
jgi:hypothetical protein